MSKIIRKSNFDHEDWRGNQYFITPARLSERQIAVVVRVCGTLGLHHLNQQELSEEEADAVAAVLNSLEGPHSDDYYQVVGDDYKLPPDWEP